MNTIPPHSNQNDDPSENGGDEVDKAFAEFNAKFPNKDDVEAFVREMFRATNGKFRIRCRYCSYRKFKFLPGGRVLRCNKCKKETWITADTLYKNVKHVRAWVAAIWFLERGVAVSRNRFSRLLEIAYSTAWEMFKRLAIVIQSQMTMKALMVPSGYFLRALSKRSRLTPAGDDPSGEEAEAERVKAVWVEGASESAATREDSSVSKSATNYATRNIRSHDQTKAKSQAPELSAAVLDHLSQLEKEIYEMLGNKPLKLEFVRELTGKPAREILSAISMLEIQGLIDKCDHGYIQVQTAQANPDEPELSSEDLMTIAGYIKFVHRNFHGISRKYLQLFLAEYWCLMDRKRWKIDSLLRVCQRFRAIPYEEIQAYESPRLVKMKF